MDLNQVAVFTKVVEVGSFVGAGKQLELPKGTVSRKVAMLEHSLGVRLLHRTTRKLRLTEIGRAYYDQCQHGLAEIDQANRLLTDSATLPRGVLRISAPLGFESGFFNDWVREFLTTYPQVKVELILKDEFGDPIEEGVDLAFRPGKPKNTSLIVRKLGNTRLILCASPRYLAKSGEPKNLIDLRGHHCVIFGSSVENCTWQLQGKVGGKKIVNVKGLIAVNTIYFARQATLSGLGIALLPLRAVAEDLKAGRLKIVLPSYSAITDGIYVTYPSRQHLPAKVRAFLDLVVEKVKATSPWDVAQKC